MKKQIIKINSIVQVIAGDFKGYKGKIVELNYENKKAKVKGCFLQTHFLKESKSIIKKEGWIHISNLKAL